MPAARHHRLWAVPESGVYFWGQGPVVFDIPKSQIIGYWWLMGEV